MKGWILVAMTLLMVPAHAAFMKGLYRFGSEEESFQPCDSHKVYWIKNNRRLLAPLRHEAKKLHHPGQPGNAPIYIEVQGKLGPRLTKGWAMDYDGLLTIDRIAKFLLYTPSNCAPG